MISGRLLSLVLTTSKRMNRKAQIAHPAIDDRVDDLLFLISIDHGAFKYRNKIGIAFYDRTQQRMSAYTVSSGFCSTAQVE